MSARLTKKDKTENRDGIIAQIARHVANIQRLCFRFGLSGRKVMSHYPAHNKTRNRHNKQDNILDPYNSIFHHIHHPFRFVNIPTLIIN